MRMHLGRAHGTGLNFETDFRGEICKRVLIIFYSSTNVVKKICLQNKILKKIIFL